MIYLSIYRKETEKAEMVIECLEPRGNRRPLRIGIQKGERERCPKDNGINTAY